jgi:hypothetical protein
MFKIIYQCIEIRLQIKAHRFSQKIREDDT